jgi:organic hydroperoxide reductase OsmC/OhrA
MRPYPHEYAVEASADALGSVALRTEGVPELASAPPVEFDGPGDQWSPETLLVAAVADCFILTFRAIARASKLSWTRLACQVSGKLDRVDRETRFVAIHIEADLVIPVSPDGESPGGASAEVEAARRMLEKAERGCLISRSLKAEPTLEARVTQA